MTKTERKLLGKLVNALRRSSPSQWEWLKESIADYGYQSYYDAEDYYREGAEKRINLLPEATKKELIREWKSVSRLIKLQTDEEILSQWALVVADEIKSRAFAAQR